MTPDQQFIMAIIAAVLAFMTSMVSAVVGVLVYRRTGVMSVNVDGRMTELLEVSKTAAQQAGHASGLTEGRAEGTATGMLIGQAAPSIPPTKGETS